MKSLVILTQYYPPETGAPQNRLHSLAKYLILQGVEVRVVTALPNYPQGAVFPAYRGRYSMVETIEEVPVYRIWIFATRSRGVFARMVNYISFAFTSFFSLLTSPRPEFLLCESPPLFLGITAVVISKIKRTKLIFNVSDLWPESAEKLQVVTNKSIIRLAYSLEAWIYRNAFVVTGQTKGILSSIQSRFPGTRTLWFPNGVDLDFFQHGKSDPNWRQRLSLDKDDFVLLYAGIIGHAQGLEVILKAAMLTKELPIKFVIVGDGPVKDELVVWARENALTNVIFHPGIEKALIPSLIQMCDAYVVPLKRLDIFRGAIPSKLFEPLAMEKPILLGVEGEAKKLFIEEGHAGIAFEPENATALVEAINDLVANPGKARSFGEQGRKYVENHFDRNEIHRRLLLQLQSAE